MNYHFPSVIDSSMLGTLKSCNQKFYKTYIQEYKPKGLSVHLHAGKSFASALESTRRAFYEQSQDSDQAIAQGIGTLIESYGSFECPADSPKSLERLMGAFEFYWDHYPLGQDNSSPITMPNGRRGIEFTFAHPLPILHPETGDPLIYSGAMDAIYNHAGDVYIIDEKTTSQLGATWSRQWDLRAQFTGYAWGCDKAGIHVDGALVRGVSILKTKYETQQAISYRPEWQIDRWYSELLEWVEDMVRDWKRDKFRHSLDHACADFGGCTFREICAIQNQQPYLETRFERRFWNPLTRTETLLDSTGDTEGDANG